MRKTKAEQLGMNPSTASHRLRTDILWSFIVKLGKNNCFRCKEEMTRETFSIDHIEDWLHSDRPKELFFDICNITFSHQSCNYSAASNPRKKYANRRERLDAENKVRRENWKLYGKQNKNGQRRMR